MPSNPASGSDKPTPAVSSIPVLLCRMVWMILGPMVLLITIYGLVAHGTGWFTPWGATYAGTILVMIGCRWIEQRSGAATTATGEPATAEHFRRYAWVLLMGGIAVWVLVNLFANHVLA